MLKLGEKQRLSIIKMVPFGAYLAEFMPKRGESADDLEKVLLPLKQVPDGFDVGDSLEVFLYKDSQDRLIATVNEPLLTLGKVAKVSVAAVSKIGAFVNWGLEKDLFLPFKEQTRKVAAGEEILVALYIDKSSRLAATMKIYHFLETASDYAKNDIVTGTVYEISKNFGTFVAVDDKYLALIPTKEPVTGIKIGDVIKARVTGVKEDGKLDLSLREKAYVLIDKDGEKILKALKEEGGSIPLGDKSDPEAIREKFGMSKKEFKRAAGHLYKEQKILVSDEEIKLV